MEGTLRGVGGGNGLLCASCGVGYGGMGKHLVAAGGFRMAHWIPDMEAYISD
jgi:hypothetical protein